MLEILKHCGHFWTRLLWNPREFNSDTHDLARLWVTSAKFTDEEVGELLGASGQKAAQVIKWLRRLRGGGEARPRPSVPRLLRCVQSQRLTRVLLSPTDRPSRAPVSGVKKSDQAEQERTAQPPASGLVRYRVGAQAETSEIGATSEHLAAQRLLRVVAGLLDLLAFVCGRLRPVYPGGKRSRREISLGVVCSTASGSDKGTKARN